MKLLQINTTYKTSATGTIAFQINEIALKDNNQSFLAYSGRYSQETKNHNAFRIGSKFDFYWHALITRVFDLHGFASTRATGQLIKKIESINPDIVHLHNIHGYYLNIKLLFNFLSTFNKPVVWTMHDCWAFTGHCDHFDDIGCEKWKKSCNYCPQKTQYPASFFFDNSKKNFINKRQLFNSIDNLTIIPVSFWLESKLKQSYFYNYSSEVIHNGIDLNVFNVKGNNFFDNQFKKGSKTILLGVASKWSRKKGLNEFIKLSRMLDDNFIIVLVGVDDSLKKRLPSKILSLPRIVDQNLLAEVYSSSDLFLNLSFEDTYPTTNLEAVSCGTPVLTYNTGGSPESVEGKAGYIIDKGNINQVAKTIHNIINQKDKEYSKESLRKVALRDFDKNINFLRYLELYKRILGKKY